MTYWGAGARAEAVSRIRRESLRQLPARGQGSCGPAVIRCVPARTHFIEISGASPCNRGTRWSRKTGSGRWACEAPANLSILGAVARVRVLPIGLAPVRRRVDRSGQDSPDRRPGASRPHPSISKEAGEA